MSDEENIKMIFEPITISDRTGRTVVLRNAEPSDAEELIGYLKVTAAETPFLIREPTEINLTAEQEREFINQITNADRSLMLVAMLDGKLIGSCSLSSVGTFRRYAHRCEMAIALCREYCGAGIGRQMMCILLDEAKKMGYEQAELEVVSRNTNAIALYEKLGFARFGEFPHNMKYTDGTYADSYWMMKRL